MYTLKVITENFDGSRTEEGHFLGPKYTIEYQAPDNADGIAAVVTDNKGLNTYQVFDNENGYVINSFGTAVTSILGSETKRGKEKAARDAANESGVEQ